MRVRYAGLSFSPPLLEGEGLALGNDMFVRAAVSAQAPLLPIFGNCLAAHDFLGERVTVAAAERAVGGAMEGGVMGEEDGKEGKVDE